MRTTVTLDDQLFEEAKIIAIKRRESLSSVIEQALRAFLDNNQATANAVILPVYGGSGVRPGVDLSDFRTVADVIEEVPGDAPA